jgi:hypothetical protein
MKEIDMELKMYLSTVTKALVTIAADASFPCDKTSEVPVLNPDLTRWDLSMWSDSCVVYGDGCPSCVLRDALEDLVRQYGQCDRALTIKIEEK